MVIYSHPIVITAVLLFYDTEGQQCHEMARNYPSKKFITFVPGFNVINHYLVSMTFGQNKLDRL